MDLYIGYLFLNFTFAKKNKNEKNFTRFKSIAI